MKKTNDDFDRVEASVLKVSDLIKAITMVSNDQTIELNQVNEALSEMDKLTQHNAAGAEESAEAAEELNAQASHLRESADDLKCEIDGSIAENKSGRSATIIGSLQTLRKETKKIEQLLRNSVRTSDLARLLGNNELCDISSRLGSASKGIAPSRHA